MTDPGQAMDDKREVSRLVDEVEQLRTALEASADEVDRLVEERDRLLRRVTGQARELQAANSAYSRASASHDLSTSAGLAAQFQSDQDQEELRVAFEEMQVLTEEVETANDGLLATNKALDQRVEQRTRELESKNRALTESELRFRTLIEGMPQLVWRATQCGDWTWASPQWIEYTGLSQEESAGSGWLRAFHIDDRAQAEAAWAGVNANSPPILEGRIFHKDEGRYRHFRTRAMAAIGTDGEILEWLGTSTDIDDLLALQDRQQLLVAELQHRVRNILTVVRSVFARTVEAGGDLEDIGDHFKGRLDSLARTQIVMTQNATGQVDLENLIRDELLAVGASDGPFLTIAGPDVMLTAKTAESIGLAIHELTTNAIKYGALRTRGPRLDICWEVKVSYGSKPKLELTWREQGVPAVALQPSRYGFGSELIAEALPYRLGAETSLQFLGGGVSCTISMPLPDSGASAAYGRKE